MSLLTLLEAAKYLDSAESGAAVPRDAAVGVEFEPFPPVIHPHLHLDFDLSSEETSLQTVGVDIKALRRSGCTGTREVHNKLEKYRRAQLKECFKNLLQFIGVPENRKLSNLSILRLAIRHIKSLNESYFHLKKLLSKEKFEQIELKKVIRHKLNLENSDAIDSIETAARPSSASTDTASDGVDEDDRLALSQRKNASIFSADAVATPNPDALTSSNSSSIILICQAITQSVSTVPGTIVIPPVIPASRVVVPLRTEDLAASGEPINDLGLSSAVIPASSSADFLASKSVVVRDAPCTGSTSTNSGTRSTIPPTSAEIAQHGTSRPVVQMLQHTIAQRAIVQEEKRRQMINQSQKDSNKTETVSDRVSTGLKKMTSLQPALSSNNHSLSAQHLNSSSVVPTLMSSTSSTSTPFDLKFPVFHTSPLVTAVSMSSPEYPAPTTPLSDVAPGTVAPSSARQVMLPLTSLAGTGLSGAGLFPSRVFLQVMSQEQLGAARVRSADDFVAQPCGSQLVAVYPMVPSIPLSQLLSPVAFNPSNIPQSNADPGCPQRQDVATFHPNALKLVAMDANEVVAADFPASRP